MAKVYAVKVGRQTGVFHSWADCEAQVKGFSGAEYKSFKTLEDAQAYLNGDSPVKVEPKVEPQAGSKKAVAAYVDGSFFDEFPTQYGWGFVIRDGGKTLFETYGAGEGAAASMRNIAGELAAAMRSVVWAKQNNCQVYIIYDYEGIERWVTGKWRAKNDFTKAYVEFMNKHAAYIYGFQQVKGHTGNNGNERADELARKALEAQL